MLRCDGNMKRMCDGAIDAIPKRMELASILYPLRALRVRCHVDLYVPVKKEEEEQSTKKRMRNKGIQNNYDKILEAIENGWPYQWRARGWQTKSGRRPMNSDLWAALLLVLDRHEVVWHALEEDAEDEDYIRCKQLAEAQCIAYKQRLYWY